jgi:hypothetical protein
MYLYGRPIGPSPYARVSGAAWGGIRVGATVNPSDVAKLSQDGSNVWNAAFSASGNNLAPLVAAGTLLAQDVPIPVIQDALSRGVSVLEAAAQGAAMASVIPGVGTVIGAAVGAILGVVQQIAQGVGSGDQDDRPLYLKKVEQTPTPHNTDGSPPNAGQLSAGAMLFDYHCHLLGGHMTGIAYGYAPEVDPFHVFDLETWYLDNNIFFDAHPYGTAFALRNNTANTVLSFAKRLLSSGIRHAASSDRGDLINAFRGVDPLNRAFALFDRWIPQGTVVKSPPFPLGNGSWTRTGASQIFMPDIGDKFGWWLNEQFWIMAAQNLTDHDVYQWLLTLQYVMQNTPDAPPNEPHLLYLLGYMKNLIAGTPPPPNFAALGGMHLHLVPGMVQAPKKVLPLIGLPPLAPLLAASERAKWVSFYLSQVHGSG